MLMRNKASNHSLKLALGGITMSLQLVITLTRGGGKLAVTTVVVRNLFKETCPTVAGVAMATGC